MFVNSYHFPQGFGQIVTFHNDQGRYFETAKYSFSNAMSENKT
jgi:hypothetical protein